MWADGTRYQDGRHSSISEDDSWDYIVSAYVDTKNNRSWPSCDQRIVPFSDTEEGLDDKTWDRIKSAVEAVVDHWSEGQKVLVRCQAGFNRSGLIMALVLMKLGFTAEVAIKRLRDRRSSYVLVNPVFEEYVREREREYRDEKNLAWMTRKVFWSDEKIDRLVRDIFEEEDK